MSWSSIFFFSKFAIFWRNMRNNSEHCPCEKKVLTDATYSFYQKTCSSRLCIPVKYFVVFRDPCVVADVDYLMLHRGHFLFFHLKMKISREMIFTHSIVESIGIASQSRWPRGRHELSLLARALGSPVRILLIAWMSVYAFILCLYR
jgi:hypothetical protein